MDEIVVSAFAFLGIGGGVFLPLQYGFGKIPPITASFLLATGLAALTYRYLGGIQGASFTVGTLKMGGALAALVGIAMLINHSLVPQVPPPPPPPPAYQIWEVTGQVTDESGNADAFGIAPLAPTDVVLSPTPFQLFPDNKFDMKFYVMPADPISPFPILQVSHAGYLQDNVDLNPNATTNDVQMTRTGQTIIINPIKLRPQARFIPTTTATEVDSIPAQASSTTPESHP
jgi:hypothetical protein